MISHATRRIRIIIPCFQGILRHDQCLYLLQKNILTRQFSLAFPKRYRDDKYDELRKRLRTLPYLEMLKKEEERVRHDLGSEKDERLRDIVEWSMKVFDYNATSGKKIRSATLLKTFCAYGFSLEDSAWCQWNSDKWKAAIILAWCVELIQASFAVLDDIMDESVLRRGKPCWYTKVDCSTIYGAGLDMMFNPKNQKPRFDMFTTEKYQTLTEYKTSYYTFCLPVRLAMYLAGEDSAKEFEFTRELCLKLGMYYGIQNDYFDCFGKPEYTGKIGNDIAEGKCTWLAVKFLEAATEPMKKEFFKNYGVGDKAAIANVMELYKETNLMRKFEETEMHLSEEISHLIESKNDIKGAVFYELFVQLQDISSKV